MIVANISEKLSLDYKIFLGFSFLILLNIMYRVISFKLKIGFLSFPNDLYGLNTRVMSVLIDNCCQRIRVRCGNFIYVTCIDT